MKKIFPILLAAIIFIVAFILLRPAPSRVVIVAATDLHAGHVLTDSDLTTMSVPESALAADVVTDKSMLIGQPLRIDRGQGDVMRASQIGNLIQVQPNERAMAVKIDDQNGVAGLLVPGQEVGVVASIPETNSNSAGIFSKATIEGLRVLYIDPAFSAANQANTVPQAEATSTDNTTLSGVNTTERATSGTVLLAVPTNLQTVFYDLSSQNGASQTRTVNALELLSALQSMDGATVTLYLMPQEGTAQKFSSPGLWLPNLVVTVPPTPTPMVTPTAVP